jgi:hypothetical protein
MPTRRSLLPTRVSSRMIIWKWASTMPSDDIGLVHLFTDGDDDNNDE